MTAPRKKRVWTCADFARHAFSETTPAARRRALRLLRRLNERHEGRLLRMAEGQREITFYVGTLARLEPDLFTPVESLEFRVDALEELVDDMRAVDRDIATQTTQNSRDIAMLRRARGRAA